MSPLQQAGDFLITTIFDLYTFILILRFILQYLRVNYYNPFTQFVVKATGSLVVPVRRFIPGWRGIDFATLLVILSVTLLKLTLVTLIRYKTAPFLPGLLIWSIGDILKLTVNIYFFSMLIQVLASWVPSLSHSPMLEIIQQLTWPIIKPFKKIIPPIGGMDITPIPVIILLQLINILFTNSIIIVGIQIALWP